MSKKWESQPVLGEDGEPLKTKTGKAVLKQSYSVLQDNFFEHMRAAGYTDVERGERGSSEEHLTVTQFKVMKEQERLSELQETKTEIQSEIAELQEAHAKESEKLDKTKERIQKQKLDLKRIDEIEAKPTLIGNKVTVDKDDFAMVITAAKKHILGITYTQGPNGLQGMQNGFGVYAVSASAQTVILKDTTIANFNKGAVIARDMIDLQMDGCTITGGNFDSNVTECLASGYDVDENGNVYKKPTGGGTVTPTPTPTPEPEELPFTDMAEGQWFYEAVKYVYDAELMNGITDTTFEPDSTTTRGMIVTVLSRMAGEREVSGESIFTDVAARSWYEDAINWAAANEIVNGYGEGIFAPDRTITREEMAAILNRYAEFAGLDVSASDDLTVFPDADSVSDRAETNVSWAVAEGLLTGQDDSTLDLAGTATRAEIATILMRYCENVAK